MSSFRKAVEFGRQFDGVSIGHDVALVAGPCRKGELAVQTEGIQIGSKVTIDLVRTDQVRNAE